MEGSYDADIKLTSDGRWAYTVSAGDPESSHRVIAGATALFRWVALSALLLGIGCQSAGSTKEGHIAIEASKRLVREHGWTDFKVYSCHFREGRWFVTLVRRPTRMVNSEAIVEVSPDGRVIDYHTPKE